MPSRIRSNGSIKRCVCSLMGQGFLENTIRAIIIGLIDMDKNIVIATAKWLKPLMNPDGLHIRTECCG